jgi:multiple sugar transport system permease protein
MKTRWYWQTIVYAILTAGVLVTILPFFYMVMTSFVTQAFVLPRPTDILAVRPNLDNYVSALQNNNFGRYFLNSVLVTGVTMAGALFFGSLTAYGFARFPFWGKETLFKIFLFTLMVPAVLNIVPQFTVIKSLGLVDTYAGLWLLYIGGGMVGTTFFLRGFFEAVPKELEESVVIDGGGSWTIYRNIYIPLSLPALGTLAIFSFQATWDEYFTALTILKTESSRTLPIALQLLFGKYASDWGLIFAASIIVLLPVIIVYMAFQKRFVQSGFGEGAVKG